MFEIESLIEHGAEKLCKQSVGGMNMYSVSQKLKLQRVLMSLSHIALMRPCQGLRIFIQNLASSNVLRTIQTPELYKEFIPSPLSLENKSFIYSSYTSHNTYNTLVVVSMITGMKFTTVTEL